MNLVVENTLSKIQAEIRATCLSCHREPSEVRIVAVSKLQSVHKVKALYEQGQRVFAENYVQEALAKQIELKEYKIEWHLIGQIQRKKINSILGQFSLIHSIDSLDLALAISKKCEVKKLRQKVLLQINVAGEASKEGWAVEELKTQWAALLELPGIDIQGFMTMPPLCEDPETNRKYFRALRTLRDEIQNQKTAGRTLSELSMGTSQDYNVAIQEGATLVRIGTRIFGERNSS